MAINRTHDEKNNEQHIVTVSYIETGQLIIVYILLGMGLWCLTPLSTIFSYIVAVSVIGGGNRNTRGKLSQVTDKLYHIILYRVILYIKIKVTLTDIGYHVWVLWFSCFQRFLGNGLM